MKNSDIKPFFEIYSCKDLYEKALIEYEEIKTKELTSFKLLNLIFSINHLKDWVENDERLNKIFVQELSEVLNPQKNVNFSVIRVLCNGGKHFALDEYSKKFQRIQIISKGYGCGRYGLGAYGKGEPSYAVLIEAQEKNILHILNEIMKDISTIFNKYDNNLFNPN